MAKGMLARMAAVMLLLISSVFPVITRAAGEVTQDNGMLQFRTGGHVLDFAQDMAHLVAMDRARSVEFSGTPGVMPKAVNSSPAAGATSHASPPAEVVYKELLNGITPTYAWHTFYGTSSDGSIGDNIAVDGDGNIYVVGKSNATWGSPLHPHSGGSDIVVLKLNSSGVYQWHTFYGSSGTDEGCGIALDQSGNIVIAGFSNATWGSPLNAYNKSYDIAILKLNSNGAYLWHTFLGSDSYECARNIALDASGNIYVTGYGNKTWGSPLNAYSGNYDLFVLKLNSAGTYLWHTFFGSAGIDYAWSIALDSSRNVYVTGQSFAAWGSPLHPYSGAAGTANVYVLKLNSNGTNQWHTFYPALWGWSIAVDNSSNVYVAGRSTLTWGSPVNAYSGGSDGYVLKLNSNGAYVWNTFYGAANTIDAFGVAIDGGGNVIVTGTSDASWGSPQNPFSGGTDIYLLKLDNNGVCQWNTFYGSNVSGKNDTGWGLDLDGSGNIYVTGQCWATWGSPRNPFSGGSYSDLFVLKLAVQPSAVNTSTELPTQFSLNQNYPNPFNPSTTISISLPMRSFVTLKVFDVRGREVTTLASKDLNAGTHRFEWNAANMPSGMYFYRLQAGTFTETKKLLLIR